MSQLEKRTLSIGEWCALGSVPGEPLPPVWIHVVSGSMRPLIRPFQDQALIVSISPEELKTGDIVLFSAKCVSGNYCLHRLYKIDGERVRTMGDACLHPDGWSLKQNILGKVLTINRGKRLIDCENRFYRVFFWLWMHAWRLRYPLFLIYRLCPHRRAV